MVYFGFQISRMPHAIFTRPTHLQLAHAQTNFPAVQRSALRSAKFINDCGRITLAHRWTSLISNIWRTARSGKGKDPKKLYERRITQHEEKFFQPSLKGMIRFDLNMEHDEVHGKFVLTVCTCSICIFAKKFPIAKRLCFSFHKRYD